MTGPLVIAPFRDPFFVPPPTQWFLKFNQHVVFIATGIAQGQRNSVSKVRWAPIHRNN